VSDVSQHHGVDSARTGARLALALLAYFAFVIAVITLAPFDFHTRVVALSFQVKPSDVVANVAMFLPIGFLLRSMPTRRIGRGWPAVAVAASFSVLIETAQIFIRGRYVSPVDVAANTFGAYLGVLLRDRAERWAHWNPRLAGRVGLDVPLVGLLYLLVAQVWLSGVGLVDDPRRSLTTLLLGCAGSIVLVALHRHRWQHGTRFPGHIAPPIALLGFTAGALPAISASPWLFGGMGALVGIFAAWLMRREPAVETGRFESDTLRRFIPLFTLYLVLAATWPMPRPCAPLHGAIGFIDRLNNAAVIDLLLLLEQVGGFTLLGYAVSEWRGRRERGLVDDLYVIVPATVVLAALLELTQGLLIGPGASLLRALLSTSGAAYGVAVYHLARAHVRALRLTLATDAARSTTPAGEDPLPRQTPATTIGIADHAPRALIRTTAGSA
jgi:VanZ family protein